MNKLAIEYIRSYCKEAADGEPLPPLPLGTVTDVLNKELRINLRKVYEQGVGLIKHGLFHYDVPLGLWFKHATEHSLHMRDICVLVGDWQLAYKFDHRGNYVNVKNV